jgi:ribosomal protein L11 methylase PrmA
MICDSRRLLERYFEAVAQRGRSRENWRFYLDYLFRGVDFAGRTMIDVGAGDGMFSFYAACAGATKVVSLEPKQRVQPQG